MKEAEALEMKAALESKGEVEFQVCTLGRAVTISKSMVSINVEKKKEHQREFTPSVIEPSFGIGRIIYCLYEHSFYTRPSKAENEQLNVFSFSPLVAPKKCTVLPLVKNDAFDGVAKAISRSLTRAGISNIVDITGFVCRLQLGQPFFFFPLFWSGSVSQFWQCSMVNGWEFRCSCCRYLDWETLRED